jgi:hypothetical protein
MYLLVSFFFVSDIFSFSWNWVVQRATIFDFALCYLVRWRGTHIHSFILSFSLFLFHLIKAKEPKTYSKQIYIMFFVVFSFSRD